jgi:predicted dehydrogenase
MATSTAECRQIAAAALASNSHVGVNHNATCFPGFRSAVEQIRRRRLGELQHVTVVVNVGLRQLSKGEHHHWMFRRPENLLLEQAPHPLSQILFLLGKVKSAAVLPAGEVMLNTGVRLYDTWQISLVCERGTAQCFISLGREYGDVWLQLIGQDATAFVDLRRNTFRISEKSRFMEPVDFFLDSLKNAGRTAGQASRNLTDYILGFVGLKPPGDPFFESMSRSIGGFYDALRANQRAPVGLDEGTAVIEAYEQIVAGAEPILNRVQTAGSIYA